MIPDYSANNNTLRAIPNEILDGTWDGSSPLHCWSIFTFYRGKFKRAYQLHIRFNFHPDDLNKIDPNSTTWRASISNCWGDSTRIVVKQDGHVIKGNEGASIIKEFENRVIKHKGDSDLRGYKLYRYICNFLCWFDKPISSGLDHHHIADNKIALSSFSIPALLSIPNNWLKATDDRFDNIWALTAAQHCFIHNLIIEDYCYIENYRFVNSC